MSFGQHGDQYQRSYQFMSSHTRQDRNSTSTDGSTTSDGDKPSFLQSCLSVLCCCKGKSKGPEDDSSASYGT